MSARHKPRESNESRLHVLNHNEGKEILDRQARRYFGLSGEEFVRAWKSGEMDEHPDQSAVTFVAMLIPLATGTATEP